MTTQRKLKWALVVGAVVFAVGNVIAGAIYGGGMRWISVVLWLGIAAATVWDLQRTSRDGDSR